MSILVVSGSARPNSVNKKVIPIVIEALKRVDVDGEVADLVDIALPFFDGVSSPLAPDFVITNDHVQHWTDLVGQSDGVVLVMPEYNHTMSPIQLNAIDWIGKEWRDKPVALVSYGVRSGGSQACATAREALAVNLKAKVGDNQANLYLGKDLSPEGDVQDEKTVGQKIGGAIEELIEAIGRSN